MNTNTMLAIVLGVLLLAVASAGGYRIGFEGGRAGGVVAGRAAAPATLPKSDFQLCMDRMDAGEPSMRLAGKVSLCNGK